MPNTRFWASDLFVQKTNFLVVFRPITNHVLHRYRLVFALHVGRGYLFVGSAAICELLVVDAEQGKLLAHNPLHVLVILRRTRQQGLYALHGQVAFLFRAHFATAVRRALRF